MDSVKLLRCAHEAGLTVRADGDRLVVRGPKSAEPVARDLLAHKAEIMRALASRATSPPIEDGCEAHNVSAEAVASRWAEVQLRDLAPGYCSCCGGPASPQALVCRPCTPLTPEREAELTTAPPCVRCGAPGYTCNASLIWRCETCWRADRGTS